MNETITFNKSCEILAEWLQEKTCSRFEIWVSRILIGFLGFVCLMIILKG